MEWLGVQTELSDGWTDGVQSCRSWQMDRWMGWRWHTGQEMGGDRNNEAPGPVRWNAVHVWSLSQKGNLRTDMALMENRPAQQGLVQKSMKMLHLETCGMQPVGWRKAEPSMAIPAVHIAPLGTNAGMPEWWPGGCLSGSNLCTNWWKDG